MDPDVYENHPELQIPGETVVQPLKVEDQFAIQYCQDEGAPQAVVVMTKATGITFEGWLYRIIRFVQLNADGSAQKYDANSQKICFNPDVSVTEMKSLGMIP